MSGPKCGNHCPPPGCIHCLGDLAPDPGPSRGLDTYEILVEDMDNLWDFTDQQSETILELMKANILLGHHLSQARSDSVRLEAQVMLGYCPDCANTNGNGHAPGCIGEKK